jgi:hypothetical protein
MPTYDFQCPTHGVFEEYHPIDDIPDVDACLVFETDPATGKRGPCLLPSPRMVVPTGVTVSWPLGKPSNDP